MSQRLRYLLAIVLLVSSLTLLAWAFWPGERIVQRRLIEPVEMQLPTPGGFVPSPAAQIGGCFHIFSS
ncbi:MAG: hypothetical protein N2117_00660 [Anaerolineales bacterium]|nr:hypothetical protein [Anaerolineales bacterium]MDW8276510.1 hypothetical protein [Anaerolineales bacterium]